MSEEGESGVGQTDKDKFPTVITVDGIVNSQPDTISDPEEVFTNFQAEKQQLFPEIASVDWKKRFIESVHSNKSWERPNLNTAIQMAYLAQSSGGLSQEELISGLVTLFAYERDRVQVNIDATVEVLNQTPEDKYQQRNLTRYHKEANDFDTLLARFGVKGEGGLNHDELLRWWSQQKSVIDQAYLDIHKKLSLSNLVLSNFWRDTDKVVEQINEHRCIPLLSEEYLALAETVSNEPVDFAFRTGGFATKPKYGKERAVALKIDLSLSRFMTTDHESSSETLINYPSTASSVGYISHERLHLLTDSTVRDGRVKYNNKDYLSEQRGFRTFLYLQPKVDEPPRLGAFSTTAYTQEFGLEAIDEGTVLLLEHMVGQEKPDIDQALAVIEQRRCFYSPEYLEAVRLTAQIARVVGINTLKNAYIHSNIDEWLEAMGELRSSYEQKMKQIQIKMAKSV